MELWNKLQYAFSGYKIYSPLYHSLVKIITVLNYH